MSDEIDQMLDDEPEPTPEQEAALSADYAEWLHKRGEKDRQIAALTAERDRMKRKCLDYENEIASVCGEDYSLKETFDAMSKQIDRHITQRDQLRAALEAVEWSDMGYNPTTHKHEPECPECEGRKPNHSPDCIVGLALKGRE